MLLISSIMMLCSVAQCQRELGVLLVLPAATAFSIASEFRAEWELADLQLCDLELQPLISLTPCSHWQVAAEQIGCFRKRVLEANERAENIAMLALPIEDQQACSSLCWLFLFIRSLFFSWSYLHPTPSPDHSLSCFLPQIFFTIDKQRMPLQFSQNSSGSYCDPLLPVTLCFQTLLPKKYCGS